MTKFLRIALLVFSLSSVANAEQSGGFLGLEAGYATINVPFDFHLKNTQNVIQTQLSGNFNGGGVAFGFTGGYKQFFSPYFGLRYYGNINIVVGKVSPKITKRSGQTLTLDAGDNRSVMLVNYALNMDVLINFIAREKNRVADFGMFAGIGLGGNNWSGQAINDIDYYINEREKDYQQPLGWKTARNFFDFSLNVGLRTNILVNHGLELALRMSVNENAFVNKEKQGNNNPTLIFKVNTKAPSYNIALRYTYSFGKAKKVVRKVIKKRKTTDPTTTQQTTNNSETR